MRTDFAPIRESMNNLVDTIAGLHKQMLAQANAERAELLALYQRTRDTQEDMHELTQIIGDAVTELGAVEEVATEHAILIEDTLSGGIDFVPTCDYEDFVGFCDSCGASVERESDYDEDGTGLFCEKCVEAYESADAEIFGSEDNDTDNVSDASDEVVAE